MGFHPKMFSVIQGFTLLDNNWVLPLDGMAIDKWQVACQENASGHYVSLHPRVVVMLGESRLHVTAERGAQPQSCAACYIPAGMEMWSRFEQPSQMQHIDIHISSKRLKALLGAQSSAPTQPIFLSSLGAIEPMVHLVGERDRSAFHRERLAEVIILEILHQGRMPKAPDQTVAAGPADAPDWLPMLEQHVHNNLTRRHDVNELAAMVGLSRTQFNRVMRQSTGSSPYQWVLCQRVIKAQQMIREGHAFADVASMAGFADQAHFNRVFKAVTGQKPSHWMIEPVK